jgi:glycosyltransferase involved in cell wall biosynthesis
MRILFVNNHARVTGGADVHCFALDRLLRERGHETRFLSTRHPENILDRGAFVPQIVDRAGRDSLSKRAAAGVFAMSCWNRDAAAATERLLTDFKPDVVHLHKLYPQLSVAPVVAAARRSVPIVQTAHDYEFVSASAIDDTGRWYDRDETRPSYQLLNAVLFRIKRALHVPRVSRWITVSRDLAGVYRSNGGIEARPLPNFVAAASDQSLSAERQGVLFVGRLAKEKGVDQIIELARRLPDLPVTIAGPGPLADHVTAAAAILPNLSFSGVLDPVEVEAKMRSAQLVLMPGAWREPAGLVALEAMRAGTPVVAYDRGGLAEYVRDAGAGLAVPPRLDDLVDAVTSLLHDRDRWNRLAANAASAAHTTHSPENYLDQLERLYVSAVRPLPVATGAAGDRKSR